MKKHLENRKARLTLAAAGILVAALSLDAAIYVENSGNGNGVNTFQLNGMSVKTAGINPFSRGTMATFVVRKTPRDFANVEFRDSTGKKMTLKDWRGKVVLLNLWATWCAPCRYEMPELDRQIKCHPALPMRYQTFVALSENIQSRKAAIVGRLVQFFG